MAQHKLAAFFHHAHLVIVPVEYFQWLRNGRLAQVPILALVELTEFVDQSWHVDVIVVVEMAEPSGKDKRCS